MMGHNQQIMCQMCPDHNRVRLAADTARNILSRLNHLFNQAPPLDRRMLQRIALFHEPVHCSWTGSSCPEFRRHLHELRRWEQELEEGFVRLRAWLKEIAEKGEKDKADRLRHECLQFFRGHYPMAARTLMQER